MTGAFTDDPEVYCPACTMTFTLADSFDYGDGADCKCTECGAELICSETEVERRWYWDLANPPKGAA